jgi:hypothetical protein
MATHGSRTRVLTQDHQSGSVSKASLEISGLYPTSTHLRRNRQQNRANGVRLKQTTRSLVSGTAAARSTPVRGFKAPLLETRTVASTAESFIHQLLCMVGSLAITLGADTLQQPVASTRATLPIDSLRSQGYINLTRSDSLRFRTTDLDTVASIGDPIAFDTTKTENGKGRLVAATVFVALIAFIVFLHFVARDAFKRSQVRSRSTAVSREDGTSAASFSSASPVPAVSPREVPSPPSG